jgi:cation transport ATPase
LALRVNTLINLLAVNNGGDTFDAADYTPLFANIIRMGLIPQEETFRQSELYQYYKMNSKIANLPKDTTCEIVTEMHKKMMDGMKEDELLRELNEMVTDGEIKASKALDQAKDDLYHAQKEIEKSKNQNSKLREKIKADIKEQITNKYDQETIRLKRGYKRKFLLFVTIFVVLLVCGTLFTDSIPFWISLIFSLIVSVLATYLCNIQTDKKIVEERARKRDTEINRLVDEEFQRKLASIEGNGY